VYCMVNSGASLYEIILNRRYVRVGWSVLNVIHFKSHVNQYLLAFVRRIRFKYMKTACDATFQTNRQRNASPVVTLSVDAQHLSQQHIMIIIC